MSNLSSLLTGAPSLPSLPSLPGSEGGANQTYGNQTLFTAMERPAEYTKMFRDFFNEYFGASAGDLGRKESYSNQLNIAKRKLADYQVVYDKAIRDGKTPNDARMQQLQDNLTRAQRRYDIYNQPGPAEAAYEGINEEQKQAWQGLQGYQKENVGKVQDAYSLAGANYDTTAKGLLDSILNRQSILPTEMSSALSSIASPQQITMGDTGQGFSFMPKGNASALQSLMDYATSLMGQAGDLNKNRYDTATKAAGSSFDIGMMPYQTAFNESQANPQGQGLINYLQDMRSLWEPMEYTRFAAQPSQTTTGDQPAPEDSEMVKLFAPWR